MTAGPAGRAPDPAGSSRPGLHALAVIGLGLLVGLGFVLPILAFLRTRPGTGRTAAVLLAAVAAVLLIRRLGRALAQVLDALPQPWRLPLLVAYAVSAMALPASLLLLRPGPPAASDLPAAPPRGH